MSGWDELFEHLEDNPSCPDITVDRYKAEEVIVALIVDNEERQDPYIAVTDVVNRRLGFQNTVTQQNVWFGLSALREIGSSFVANLMCTRSGRDKLAGWISAGAVPNMNEEDRNRIISRIGEPLSSLFLPDPE